MAQINDTPCQLDAHLRTIGKICDLFQDLYGTGSPQLGELLHDAVDLYAGGWPAYEPCQVGYHTIQHATDVALLCARVVSGWNRTEAEPFSADAFLVVMAAALFHDSGYIKDRGDQVGAGGKFTYSHVERSKRIITDYLTAKGWAEPAIATTGSLLDATEFSHMVELPSRYPDPCAQRLAAILGTADMIAQMSDVNYMANLPALYQEFEEAYDAIGRDELRRQGHRVYGSATEMLNETVSFYESIVLPRLRHFGRMDRYLVAYFGHGRNPYLENITANLTGQILSNDAQWQRIGTILTTLGSITQEQLAEALRRQSTPATSSPASDTGHSFQKRFLSWSNTQKKKKTLGDILIGMEAMEPKLLCQGLLAQILPPAGFAKLDRDLLELLLKVSIMLHSSYNDPWMFQQVLSLVADHLKCAGGSILLAMPDRQEMIVAVSTLLAKEHYVGKIIPADKGLAGWVCRHGQTAIVNAVDRDCRFEKSLDQRAPCSPDSILAVPMHHNGARFGVVELFNKPAPGFTEEDAALLVMVANIVAVALGAILS